MGFSVKTEASNEEARITLKGELDAGSAPTFQKAIEEAMVQHPKRLVLFAQELDFMASAGLRILIFAKQKLGGGVPIYMIGAKGPVLNTLQLSGFHHSIYIQDTYNPE